MGLLIPGVDTVEENGATLVCAMSSSSFPSVLICNEFPHTLSKPSAASRSGIRIHAALIWLIYNRVIDDSETVHSWLSSLAS